MEKLNQKLNQKLELLNSCLVKKSIPQTLAKELQEYTGDFEIFKQIAHECGSSMDEAYIDAFSIFRDVLLSGKN